MFNIILAQKRLNYVSLSRSQFLKLPSRKRARRKFHKTRRRPSQIRYSSRNQTGEELTVRLVKETSQNSLFPSPLKAVKRPAPTYNLVSRTAIRKAESFVCSRVYYHVCIQSLSQIDPGTRVSRGRMKPQSRFKSRKILDKHVAENITCRKTFCDLSLWIPILPKLEQGYSETRAALSFYSRWIVVIFIIIPMISAFLYILYNLSHHTSPHIF